MVIYFQDFSRILQAIERGSCRSVDEYANDLVTGQDKDETNDTENAPGDTYDALSEWEQSIFPFGKAITKPRGDAKLYNWICGGCH